MAGARGLPALADGVLNVASDGTVSAIDAATGATRWWRVAVASSPTVAGAAVYVGGSDERLRAIDGATGRERWRVRLGGVLVSSPAVHGESVYLGGTQRAGRSRRPGFSP